MNVWMLRANSGRERALFGRNRGKEGDAQGTPSAEAHALGAPDSIGVGGLRCCLDGNRSTCRAATPSRSGINVRGWRRGPEAPPREVAQQARELLAPVYGRFTGGFDTLDLKEAKALLDGLAP